MRYQFLLNGIDVTDRVQLGVNIKERFAEELDVGSLTLSYFELGDTIKVLSRVEIIKYDDNDNIIKKYDMLVSEDSVEPITKTNNLFKHELSLVELTHKLDYYLINSLSFTQPIEEGVKAPFKHEFSIREVNDDKPVYSKVSTIEFPQLPELVNRYYDGSITIPKMEKAILSLPNDPYGINLLVSGNFDILLTVKRNNNNVITTVRNAYNITQSDLVLTDLPNGTYTFDFFVDEVVEAPKQPESQSVFEPPVFVEVKRRFIFESIFTIRKRYSMFDVIERIKNTYPIERADLHEQTRVFKISTALENKLKEIPAPQLYMNRLTLRESINNALRYVNAVSRLIDNDGNELTANFFNERKGSFLFNDNTKFQSIASQDAGNYASVNRAYLNNVIASNNTDNPSVQIMLGSLTGLRSESYQLLPENGKIMLTYDILRLVKVVARVKLRLAYTRYLTQQETFPQPDEVINVFEEIDLDVTPYIVEETIYNLLDPIVDTFGTSGNFNELRNEFFRDKKNQIAFYRYRSNFIDFGGTVGSFYPRTRLNRVLESAITEYLSQRVGERLRLPDGSYNNNYVYRGRQSLLNEPGFFNSAIDLFGKDETQPLNLTNTDYLEEIGFNVSYIAIERTVDDAFKEDTEYINKYTERVINNNDRVINYERAAISNYGISQRLGVPTRRYGAVYKMANSEDSEQVGFINDRNEVVVEKDNVIYKDHELYVTETSRDFNRLAKFIAVDRQYRPTEIPSSRETLERDDIYTEFIEYSTSNELITPRENDTFINNKFLEIFLNTLERNVNKEVESVKGVLVRTDGFLEKFPDIYNEFDSLELSRALLISVISLGGKNNLSFEFDFNSNVSAGDRIEENQNGTDTIVDWWNTMSSQITEWFENLTDGQDYSPRPYGLWRQFVPYGNDNGEFRLLHFKLLTDFNLGTANISSNRYFTETRNLPLVKSFSAFSEQANLLVAESGNNITFDKALVINKDVSEIFTLKYQVTLVPTSDENNRNIVIGQKLTGENLLVYFYQDKQLKLYLYNDENKK